jgi:hypothetical protein
MPVAALIVLQPCVEFKAIETSPLDADGDLRQVLPHCAVEAIAIHAEVAVGVPAANDPRQNREGTRLRSKAAHRANPTHMVRSLGWAS